MRYFLITGMDEGTEIEPFRVEGLETACRICDVGGDAVRYREEISKKEYGKGDGVEMVKVEKKSLQAWWCRDGITTYKTVKSEREAIVWLNEQTHLDLEDESITWNASGLEEFIDGDWSEYYNEDGLDIKEIIEERDNVE